MSMQGTFKSAENNQYTVHITKSHPNFASDLHQFLSTVKSWTKGACTNNLVSSNEHVKKLDNLFKLLKQMIHLFWTPPKPLQSSFQTQSP